MKIQIFLLLAIIGIICAAPTLENGEKSDSVEVKADVTSSLIESTDVNSEDSARSKKSPDGPKTVCQTVQTIDGKSYLQCAEEPAIASTNSFSSYSAVPHAGSHQMTPGNSYNGYNQAEYNFKPAMTYNQHASNQGYQMNPGYSAPPPKPAPANSYYSSYSSMAPGMQYTQPANGYQYYAANPNKPRDFSAEEQFDFTVNERAAAAPQYAPPQPAQYYNYNQYQAPNVQSYGYGSYGPAAAANAASNYNKQPPHIQRQSSPQQIDREMQAEAYSRSAMDYERAAPPPAPVHYEKSPSIPCPTNLLFSCAPNVAPVPCVAEHKPPPPPPVHHQPEAAYPIAPSYNYNNYVQQQPAQIAPPTPSSYQNNAKPKYRSEDEANTNQNQVIVQPTTSMDDDKVKKDWS